MSATAFDPQRRRFGSGGDVYDIVATSEETRNTHFALIATEPPGGGPPLHTHAEDEFFFVLDGDISFWIDGRITVASAGETRCLPCVVLPVSRLCESAVEPLRIPSDSAPYTQQQYTKPAGAGRANSTPDIRVCACAPTSRHEHGSAALWYDVSSLLN
jgi:hypothetical protein